MSAPTEGAGSPSDGGALRYSGTLDLPLDVRRLWPGLAATLEINRMSGKPRGQQQPQDETLPVPALPFATRKGGMDLIWAEEPYHFVRYRYFYGDILFRRGPLQRMRVDIRFEPVGERSTRVQVLFGGDVPSPPKGWIGRLILRSTFRGTVRAMREIAARIAEGRVVDPLSPSPAGGDPAVALRMRQALAGVEPADEDEQRILDRLVEQVAGASESEAARLRPFALARRWRTDPRRTLITLLRAARAGALVLRWDLVCPDCRRPPARVAHLAELAGRQHCDTCAITFGVELDRHVEVTFRPAPAVRTVDEHVFCFTDPARQTHVVAQGIVDAGATWDVSLDLDPGAHRLRVRRAIGGVAIEARPDAPAEVAIDLVPDASGTQPVAIRSGGARLRVRLGGEQRRLVLVEHATWLDDAALAAEVTSLQAFRQLFPGEAVSAGERIEVRRLAFLFTDLKDSTALYERVGDGPAYGAVSAHFRVLEGAISDEAGAVVKTIGDAVMAVFPDAAHATRAAVRMQRDIARWNNERGDREPIVVKVGLHEGPCVAVNANGALDYFGSTVNVAARVQALSQGGDLVLAAEIAAVPAVAAALDGLLRERFAAALKGLASEIEVLRVHVTP